MTSQIFSEALPMGAPLNEMLKSAIPRHILDVVSAASLGALGIAYLFPRYTWNKPDPYEYIYYEKPQSGEHAGGANKVTRNIAKYLEETEKDVVIFWGSQSGTAEAFSGRLARELQKLYALGCIAADLSDFDPESIADIPQNRVAIFLLSTYGEGDPSDNAAQFWNWCLKNNQAPLLSLRYAAFGLGNSNYRFYNEVVNRVVAALQVFGAQPLMETGYADDAHGSTEEDFTGWKDKLFNCLQERLGLTKREVGYEATIAAVFDESLDIVDLHVGEPQENTPTSKGLLSPTRAVQVKSCEQLFLSGSRNCLHMDLDLVAHPELVYKTGDHLGISPINPEQEVHGMLRALGREAQAKTPLIINALESGTKVALPSPTTLHALLKYYLEICSAVPRETVRALIEFAPTPEAKKFLTELSDDHETFAKFQETIHLTFSKLLVLATGGGKATWSSLPLEFILETIPRCRVRYYSIASSSVLSPRTASITALVNNTVLSETESIPGVTTNYLLAISQSVGKDALQGSRRANLDFDVSGPSGALEGAKIFAHLRRSTFKLPISVQTPFIMAAAGTGIAPFRAFISERSRLQSMGRDVGHMMLFFGCRSPEEDYIYREELEEMERSLRGKLRIIPVYSRARDTPRAYVQDKIRELTTDVLGLLEQDAVFYICGKTTMAKDISKVVADLLEEGQGAGKGDELIRKMKKTNKWQEDTWG
ncbi:unnamed protein product [Clonostachys byssicola]|uniref:NADPH--cytochrome P450 reductase n=1 Tax=Clonostachys byssicola TaxID=160290 RepID=A0A9N9TYJ8_9HYPO|nr:unnamed protein product [Clonostachys byssicola]